MASLDNDYSPFNGYRLWGQMAPCMKTCDDSYDFNVRKGCDKARCWCNKGNIELRMSEMTRCASELCTFANMNPATDLSIMSVVQVRYCVDKGFSPEGMALPSDAIAAPTSSSGTDDASATPTDTLPSETGARSRTGLDSGPSPTSGVVDVSIGSSDLSTAAKAGIGIGAAFCVLLAILIVILLFRRRKRAPQYYPPPPADNQFQNGSQPMGPPPMAPTPYSNTGPYTPPPLQQPAPIHPPPQPYTKGDVSPIEEKAVPAVTVPRKSGGGGGVTTKEISSPPSSPTPLAAVPNTRTQEFAGSVPPPRHEVSNDGQITNTVSTRGMEIDGHERPVVNQYPGQQQYQQSAQGQWAYHHPSAYEVDGGAVQRQEVGGGSQMHAPYYHGAPYELGPGGRQ
ncbi:hypothetical protein M011DRAFT_457054 [Sporormia fimetaria CBS 119925]|uniref:Extracellular membrane protein CFEM domain-containing protein n=1 Tax=Sporormia fimetaria CBS 119925 TaxID=1340428 RepID=A0A6A6VE84_9PLEO|nr:hypothetical protein M011DRAFT_457054 [Sporormia fimetaria CBS 119925]